MPKQTLLAILAHPDDESFGPGGTFARYAAEGHDIHICIATDGAAGSIDPSLPPEQRDNAHRDLVAVRRAELAEACHILGATLHTLGYRDSGMTGNDANHHPDAFIQSNDAEAIARIVRLIRTLKPDVVVTHDETGGYYHPDHIRCWAMTTAAFHAAGRDDYMTALGERPPHQADRLYYTAFSNRWVKVLSLAMRLGGKNPRQVGTNKDIDITKLGIHPHKIHAYINYTAHWAEKESASRAHASQGGGSGGPARAIPRIVRHRLLSTDTFIRAYPPVPDQFRETSLFP